VNLDNSQVEKLTELAKQYLRKLCVEIPTRQVGSAGNLAATDYFFACLRSASFEVDRQWFDCIDWEERGAHLTIENAMGRMTFAVTPSPYSLGVQARGSLVSAASVDELETVDAAGKVLLLLGELTKEQLMPKNFPFYNPEEHQHIYSLLEKKLPLAIVTATTRNPELAGGVYPFPMIEDGDFATPSVFTTTEEGENLAQHTGETVFLSINSRRIPAVGCNVVGRKGLANGKRIVVTAHIDAKPGTPGALDNAAGVVVLLLLAEMLRDYAGERCIEIVALNGEDYYAASGEITYLQHNQGQFKDIMVNINIDGAGYNEGETAWSHYNCPEALASRVLQLVAETPGMIRGEPWYQGDHMIFVQNDIPAIAITTEYFWKISSEITHTAEDRLELVDADKLVAIASLLYKLLTK
jgi:aminopeptidase YwaD